MATDLHAAIVTTYTHMVDRDSHAWAHGFNQAVSGREFRNPCEGNPRGTDNHYFGYLAGETARERGMDRAAYDASYPAA